MSTPKGLEMLALTLIFLTVVQECFAVRCGSYPIYKYCSDYCCGWNNDCCYYTPYTSYYTWGIGTTVGIVIGSIVGLIILIVIIVAIVKACTKTSGVHGRVVQPYYNPAAGVIVTTGTQPGYSGPPAMYPQSPMYPQPSTYPPPPPAFAGPKQGAAPPPPTS